jgi:hypothetical protein
MDDAQNITWKYIHFIYNMNILYYDWYIFIDDEDVIDKEHPKSWQKYFDRAIQLNSVDAWLNVAYSLASGQYRIRDSSIFVSYKPDMSELEAQKEADQIFERIFPNFLEPNFEVLSA